MELQWPLIIFTTLVSWCAGTFATQAYLGLKGAGKKAQMPCWIVSAVLLVVGGIAVFFHLQHWERIFNGFGHITSGITQELIAIILLAIVAVIYLAMLRKNDNTVPKWVAILAIVMSAVLVMVMGHSYMMEARQAWMTIALPLSYWSTAAVAGAGLNLLLKGLAKDEAASVSFAGVLCAVCSVVALVCCAAFFIYAGAWLGGAKAGAVAWIAATFVCAAVALVAGIAAVKKAESATVLGAVACIAGVICAIAMRVAMWLVGTPLLDFFLQPLD